MILFALSKTRSQFFPFAQILCFVIGVLLISNPSPADSIEDVQGNSFRRVMSLDGEWELSGLQKTDVVVPWASDSLFMKGWATGSKVEGVEKVQVPLNLFYPWLKISPVWKPGVGTDDPLRGCEYLFGLSQQCRVFYEGKQNLVVWYRRTFSVPKVEDSRRIFLHFAGVTTTAEVFVNGQFVGRHVGGFAAFCVDATPRIKAGDNLVAVRCTIRAGGEHTQHWGNSNPYYAGLWRSVHLLELHEDAVKYVLIDPWPRDKKLSVRVRIFKEPAQPLEVRASIKGREAMSVGGTIGGGQREVRLTLPFSGEEWWPETPVLHRLKVVLARKGIVVDEKETRFGFRSFQAEGERLLLNGRPYRLMGYGENGNHFGGEGYSSRQVQDRYAQLCLAYKRAGGNAVRWHNASISERNRAADEIGYLVYSGGPDENLAKDFGNDYWTYLREYVFQNYNHPSVVVWHFSNEDWTDPEWGTLNDIYDKVRPLDTSGRPLIPDSGSYSFPGLPTIKGKTDVVDVHVYTGVSCKAFGGLLKVPFTQTGKVMEEISARIARIFGRRMPIIVGEAQAETIWEGMGSGRWSGPNLGGYHRKPIGPDKLVRPEIFEEIRQYTHTWCDIGHGVKNLGLVTYMGKPDGLDVGRLADWTGAEIVKNCIEQYRLMKVPGIFVNQGRPDNWLRLLNGVLSGRNYGQTIFSPIMPIAIDIPRQIFSSQLVGMTVWVDNNTGRDEAELTLKLIVDEPGKKVICSGSPVKIPRVASQSAAAVPVRFQVPETFSGPATLHLAVYRNDKIVGETFYYFSVTPSAARNPVTAKQRLWVWKPQEKNISDTLRVLDDLKIAYRLITSKELRAKPKLKLSGWLLVPARSVFDGRENPEWRSVSDTVRQDMANGLNVVVLEQCGEGLLNLGPGMEYLHRAGNITADPTVFDHPILARVPWHKWWIWSGDDGDITPWVMPAGRNTLAVIGAHEDDRVYSILSEGRVEKGRILLSQPQAVNRWGKDAAATLYLRELFDYALNGEPWKRLGPWGGKSREYAVEKRERLLCVDLRPWFNRSWSDETLGDGKGGWTDEGNNDFSHFAPPRMDPNFETYQKSYAPHLAGKAWLLGLPFDIPINGATEKSCLVVGVGKLPKAVKNIPINQKVRRIFILGTATYNGKGTITLSYEDGQTVAVPTKFPDWWAGGDTDEVRVAWKGTNPKSGASVSCFIQPWDNPRPEKKIINASLEGDHVVLLGLTIERTN